ncbi:MAG: phytanoyl-CoA dioxygenase family protein [Myxococcota bacterium]|nr:phytanoyl-CoA dioxygenase family protein [Myxococcota bacterium]
MESFRLRPKAADEAENISYWRELVPSLHIQDQASSVLTETSFSSGLGEANERKLLCDKGYLQKTHFIPSAQCETLVRAVELIRKEGWPEPFLFLFDEVWQCAARIANVYEKLIQAPVYMLPDFWAWYLDPLNYESGWSKHRDRDADCIDENGLPESLTAWIALTDARIDNGCIWLLPADKDPRYRTDFRDLSVACPEDVVPLECAAGTLLLWNQVVLHWGGQSLPTAPHPRVSFAFEFQRVDVPPHNSPLLNPSELPTFNQRLALVAKQLLQYQHMYVIPRWLVQIAEDWKETFSLPKGV